MSYDTTLFTRWGCTERVRKKSERSSPLPRRTRISVGPVFWTMDPKRALDRAVGLSCWPEGIKIEPTSTLDADELGLGCGRTNQNFLATAPDGTRYFVRIGLDLPAFGVLRSKEMAAARAAAATGIGAGILHTELPDALVTSFMRGRALTEAQCHAACRGEDDGLLEALVDAIRKLHATEVPPELLAASPPGAPCWSPPDLQRWIAGARAGGFSRVPLLDDCDALIESAEQFVSAVWPAAPPRFCHFDLLPDNFVVHRPDAGPVEVSIVDFEYANAGQPLMDLAVLSMGSDLSPAEERRLLARYLQKEEASDAEAARFVTLKMLATLRETFWGVTAEVSKTSALSDEAAAAYTDENYAKHLVARKEFEALLAAQ